MTIKKVIIFLFLSDLCNFDDSPCPWKIGNWTVAKECVPSNSLGTGPCLDKNGGTSKWNWVRLFWVYLQKERSFFQFLGPGI